MLKQASFAIVMLCSTAAMAQTAGVKDYVTAKRGGTDTPQCIRVQTANGGGDTVNHSWLPCASTNPPAPGTALCIGLGTGVIGAVQNNGVIPDNLAGINAVGPVVATSILSDLNSSRWGGGVAGPWLNFTLQPQGFYGDCLPDFFGMDRVTQ